MVNSISIKINNKEVQVPEGTRIIDACRNNGYKIPSLCFLKDINEIGACRICVVEVKGISHLVPSCNNTVQEGMEILTNSPRVREARKINAELLLSQHNANCPTCVRSSNCELKRVANDLDLTDNWYKNEYPEALWSKSFPLIRDASKCIKCMRCVQICDKIQTLNIWDVSGTGSHTTVDVSNNKEIKASDCSLCGQCVTHCPTAALHERDDVEAINGIDGELANPEKVTVAIVAPSVRASWGEEFGLSPEFATDKRFVATLKSVGFDYVFDADFAADLTIMEESSELIARLREPEKYSWPMFTSCCPGWVSFAKTQYPDILPQLSTAKSPQQMFGTVIKTYFAQKKGIKPENISCVSLMPCLSKKRELTLPGMDSAGTGHDIDYVLTTREICRLIKADNIDVTLQPETNFDDPLGEASGAGVIFGTSGGVLEAALRTAYYKVTGQNPDLGENSPLKVLRNISSHKEIEIELGNKKLHCAAVSSLGEARKLITSIKRGECHYDFVEVMACPGGCINGGGQPIHPSYNSMPNSYTERDHCLREYDNRNNIRFSHENKAIQTLYNDYLDFPMSDRAHHLLHVEKY